LDASEQALVELEKKIMIDPDDLDVELVSQSNNYWHAAAGFAMALSLRDKAKNNLDVAEAELNLHFRQKATDKPTEAQLKAMVTADELRQQHVDDYISAKLLADKWLALRDSFTQKGYALRELAEQRKANYFGEHSSTSAERIEAETRVRNRATDR
jgi:hypothetical protein